MVLSGHKFLVGLHRRILNQFVRLFDQLLTAARTVRAVAPLLVVGGIVNPTRLPLFRDDSTGGKMISFKDAEEPLMSCERLTDLECRQVSEEIDALNSGLRHATDLHEGVFLDLDLKFASVLKEGEARTNNCWVPAGAFVGWDLVHPTVVGHAVIAEWFAELLRARGYDIPALPIGCVLQEHRLRTARFNRRSWRQIMTLLYEQFLYRKGSSP
jgi:hypothetical protein